MLLFAVRGRCGGPATQLLGGGAPGLPVLTSALFAYRFVEPARGRTRHVQRGPKQGNCYVRSTLDRGA